MSVHTIHTTHLDKIDMIAKSYLKKWLKIPARGVTDLTFFHPRLLDIKPPSQLYLEGHAGNYVNNRLKGDRVVNAALDLALEREKQWSRKSLTIVKCDEIFQEVAETNHIPDPTNMSLVLFLILSICLLLIYNFLALPLSEYFPHQLHF